MLSEKFFRPHRGALSAPAERSERMICDAGYSTRQYPVYPSRCCSTGWRSATQLPGALCGPGLHSIVSAFGRSPSMSTDQLCITTSNDRLDLLVERVRALMENARSVATRSGYARDFSDYESFCRAHGLTAMPPSAPVIALYLAELSTRMRPATIAR